MKEKIAVALSGGIDSLVAAYLLKQQGHELIGIHFLTGYEIDPSGDGGGSAQSVASHLSAQIGIPVEVLDIRHEFTHTVVDYFIRTYRNGKTPNPCLVCNPCIKFGVLLEHARKRGAAGLATGHYAVVQRDTAGRCRLYKSADPEKDQSYFLAFMRQDQLAAACFPLGKRTKAEVLAVAAKLGLRPAVRGESQDLCFIRNRSYGDFLADQHGFEAVPGPIEDTGGTRIGEHRGLHLFTVGQRRGINCPDAEPYYVVRIDRARNTLVVGRREDLISSGCTASGISWINDPPVGPVRVHTRLRYRHRAVASTLLPTAAEATASIRFDAPQDAVTPGQGAVFYLKDEVIGGGWIDSGTSPGE